MTLHFAIQRNKVKIAKCNLFFAICNCEIKKSQLSFNMFYSVPETSFHKPLIKTPRSCRVAAHDKSVNIHSNLLLLLLFFFKYGFNVSSNVLGHIWNGRHENNKNDPTVGRLVGSLNWTVGRR